MLKQFSIKIYKYKYYIYLSEQNTQRRANKKKMSFAQRLMKIQRRSSQGNQYKSQNLNSKNEKQKLSIKNNNKTVTQFQKHHNELKDMLQFLQFDKSVNLCKTPKKSTEKDQDSKKLSLNKSMKIETKQNTYNKVKFLNTPDKGLKLRINRVPPQSDTFDFDRDTVLSRNLKNTNKIIKQNPQSITPNIKKPITNKINYSNKQKRGIPNIGNSCYMNAVLQCLFHLKDFNEGFFAQYTDKKQILNKYLKLFSAIIQKNSTQTDISTLSLKKSVSKICSLFIDFHQQDAHQFLKQLLDSIHQQINRIKTPAVYKILNYNTNKNNLSVLSYQYWQYYKKFDDSYIYDSLCGQICNYVTCINCKYQSVGFDNFLDLSLPMIKGKNKLQELLKEYFDVEALSDFYYCQHCKKTSKKCLKRCELWRTPNYLIIQLKRSQFGKKNNENIKIPVKCLNLKQFMNTQDKQTKPSMYHLQGIVLHRGIIEGGHYWAHVKDGLNWYSVDDQKVEKFDRDKLIHQYQIEGSGDAYILFYKAM